MRPNGDGDEAFNAMRGTRRHRAGVLLRPPEPTVSASDQAHPEDDDQVVPLGEPPSASEDDPVTSILATASEGAPLSGDLSIELPDSVDSTIENWSAVSRQMHLLVEQTFTLKSAYSEAVAEAARQRQAADDALQVNAELTQRLNEASAQLAAATLAKELAEQRLVAAQTSIEAAEERAIAAERHLEALQRAPEEPIDTGAHDNTDETKDGVLPVGVAQADSPQSDNLRLQAQKSLDQMQGALSQLAAVHDSALATMASLRASLVAWDPRTDNHLSEAAVNPGVAGTDRQRPTGLPSGASPRPATAFTVAKDRAESGIATQLPSSRTPLPVPAPERHIPQPSSRTPQPDETTQVREDEPNAGILTEVTIVAGPFTSFASVHEFRKAMAGLPGIRELQFRGFEESYLQVWVRYESPVPIVDRLRAVGPFRCRVLNVSGRTITLVIVADVRRDYSSAG